MRTSTMLKTNRGALAAPSAAAVGRPCATSAARRSGWRAQPTVSGALGRPRTTVLTGAVVADKNVNDIGADMPQPIVKINNEDDPLATIVTIKFGDYLGDLLDTVNALRNLNLNIVRAKFEVDGNRNKFYLTDSKTGEKIFDCDRIEDIRMTIINNLMLYHPESLDELSSFFRAKRAMEPLSALGARGAPSVSTDITLHADKNGIRTILEVTTGDRPGLLVDIVRTLKDISVNVVSAKAETIGKAAHDVFAVTYHGEPLTPPMELLVSNALYYYLARAEVEREESY